MKILNTAYYILLVAIGLVAFILLLSVLPIPGTIKLMVVQSGSMEPAISSGSIVIVRPVSEYKVGNIITFGPWDRVTSPTTHRIYEVRQYDDHTAYITKGDANNGPDVREIHERDVVGKMLFSVPYAGYAVAAVRRPLGFLLVVLIPVCIVLGSEIRKLIKKIHRNRI